MKKIAALIAFVVTSLLLSACVPTNVSPVSIGPDFSENTGDYELDFIQLHNDVLGAFEEENPFVFVTGLDINGSSGERKVTVDASVMSGISAEDAGYFIAAVLRYLNDAAAVQDTRIKTSDQSSFGNFYSVFSLTARVTDESGSEVAMWNIPAGEAIPLDPDIETYYEGWEKAMEIYQRNNQ